MREIVDNAWGRGAGRVERVQRLIVSLDRLVGGDNVVRQVRPARPHVPRRDGIHSKVAVSSAWVSFRASSAGRSVLGVQLVLGPS